MTKIMETVIIEKRTFEAMMRRFDSLVGKIGRLSDEKGAKRLKKRLDNQDVCSILHISPRTLQSLRSNGSLPYIKISRKIWYEPDDVAGLIGRVFDPVKK
jgi:hypothetical protein